MPKKIVPKNHLDQRAIKIENETKNFQVKTVPSELAKEIMQEHPLSCKTRFNKKVISYIRAPCMGVYGGVFWSVKCTHGTLLPLQLPPTYVQ